MSEPILGESLAELRATRSSLKWRIYGADVLPVWVAEMDARPCQAVVDEVATAMRRGDTGYPWSEPYVEAMAAFAQRRWGWTFRAADTWLVPDVMIGIAELIRLMTDQGGPVVVSPPVYNAFYGFIEAVRRQVVEAPLDEAGRLDLDALEAAFGSVAGERATYLLCNPHNPTGTVPTAEELTALSLLAHQFGVQVISDEIHAPLVQPDVAFTPYLSVAEAGIAVASASKAWNLAALKGALVIAGEADRPTLRRLHEVHTHGASQLGMIAQTAAYSQGEQWLDQVLAELADNARLLDDLLSERLPRVRFQPPQATYLGWLDCRELGLGDDPAAVFRERGKVALASGLEYGAAGAGFARFNFATSAEVITEAVARMAAAV
jgi:cystathionine beta-lyase